MHNFLYFSAAVVVLTVVLGIFDKERRKMWLSIVGTIAAALIAVVLVAWLVFETKIF
jgi:hypothetical protein